MNYGLKTLILNANRLPNGQPKQPGIRATVRKMQLFCEDMGGSGTEFDKWLGNVLKEAHKIHYDGGWNCKNISRFQEFYLRMEAELRAFALQATKNYDDGLVAVFQNCAEKIRPGLSVQFKELDYGGSRFKFGADGGDVAFYYSASDSVSPGNCLGTKIVASVCFGSLQSFTNDVENAMRVFGKLAKAKNGLFDTSEFFRPKFYPEHAAGKDSMVMTYVYMHAKEGPRDIKPFNPAAAPKKTEEPIVSSGKEMAAGKRVPAQQTKSEQSFYPSLPKDVKMVFGSFDGS